MALSGSFSGSTNNQYIKPTITWSAKQSVSGNYSDVTATLRYSRTNTGYTTSGTWSGSITINGKSASGSKYLSITYDSDTAAITATTRVYHSADGSKSITIRASGCISGTSLESTTISDTVTLTTIPRASSVSCGSIVLGTEGTIAIQRASSNFTHTITYRLGNSSGTICTKTKATSVKWTPPLSLARQITSAASAKATLTVTTYSGSTAVGSDTAQVTLCVPSSVKPTASVTLRIVNDNSVVSGWGVAVKGYSKLRYQVTAAGAEDSAISSYQVTLAGKTYTAASGTTGILKTAGKTTVSVKVTDSRGRTASASASVTVQDYAPPALSAPSVRRSRQDGTADDEGTYLRCSCSASCTAVGNNAVTCRVRYRAKGGAWSGYTTLSGGIAAVIGGDLDAHTTYEAELSAVDALSATAPVVITVPTAAVALHLRQGGTGAAFGKYAESDDLLESAWNFSAKSVAIQGKSLAPGKLTGVFNADSTYADDHSANLRYFPAFGLVTLHLYVKLGDTALSANTAYDIGTIAEEYRPMQQEALSFYCGRGGNATIRTDGAVRMILNGSVSAGGNYGAYLTGFWFI